MKKTAVIFIITFLLSVFLIGCKEEKVGPTSQIYQLEVYNAIESSSDIYHLKFPHYYYMIDDETAKCSIYDFDNVTARENLSEEDYIYLTEYIMNLEDETPDRDDVKVYRIYLHYYDENGEEHSKSVCGYNDFPEGWSEFITRVNKICGGDYLSSTGDIVEVTPEFLTDKFGVTDQDVKEGTLVDVIEQNELDIFKISGSGFSMESELDKYYANGQETNIEPFRPMQLDMINSTQEEYDAFIEAYLDKLGGEWEELESGQQNLRYFRSTTDSKYFYIGKSSDLGEMSVIENNLGYYDMNLDAHMEDMTYTVEFYYSSDHKFILVDVSDTDMILTYIGIGAEGQ